VLDAWEGDHAERSSLASPYTGLHGVNVG